MYIIYREFDIKKIKVFYLQFPTLAGIVIYTCRIYKMPQKFCSCQHMNEMKLCTVLPRGPLASDINISQVQEF